MLVGAEQSQGSRNYQEDNFAVWSEPKDGRAVTPGCLAIVCDGMGGHQGGAIASKVAVETFVESFAAIKGDGKSRLGRALRHCNREIELEGEGHSELKGMGCTLIAVWLRDSQFHWISVGDSILWLVRDGTLTKLNDDHSMKPVFAQQVRQGEITEAQAVEHPQRNALRSALTGEKLKLIDLPKKSLTLEPNDRLVLASDGILTLSEDEILNLSRPENQPDPTKTAKKLVQAVDARQLRDQDNTTVLVVDPPERGSGGLAFADNRRKTAGALGRNLGLVSIGLIAGTAIGLAIGANLDSVAHYLGTGLGQKVESSKDSAEQGAQSVPVSKPEDKIIPTKDKNIVSDPSESVPPTDTGKISKPLPVSPTKKGSAWPPAHYQRYFRGTAQ
jgi:serine/threonine protein phosphatase PrpC